MRTCRNEGFYELHSINEGFKVEILETYDLRPLRWRKKLAVENHKEKTLRTVRKVPNHIPAKIP